MKPVGFDHTVPETLDAAIDALGAGGEVKLLGGGQSLGPMLNLRLARPERLVDIGRIDDLRSTAATDEYIEIGAGVTHAEIEDGAVPDPIPGMLPYVASGIAYRAVRNRGTLGGSLCHADPAADWISVMTALDARIVTAASDGGREIDMFTFVPGAYRTNLAPGEVVRAVRVPRFSEGAVWGYYKTCRKTGEFASAIGVFVADPAKAYCRVVFGAAAGRPLVSPTLARSIAETGRAPDLAALERELEALEPALSEVKARQLAVALRRAVSGAIG
ncbi:MAG: FAD binding domain-containing protein [Rhodobacter sp.]|nr:FAD binding domain-containing protein [Rhodobacter sp.]MCY4169736.1 FAD binding domain-containing protein [Rhodobacter sp.]MCY4241039.1 FAD binding domain-containing protein [Rhodobacter sp.]